MTTNTRPQGGSSPEFRDQAPSINLAKVAELLTQSLKSIEGFNPSSLQAFLRLEGKRLHVNTRAVLQPLVNDEFRKTFALGEDSGFLRDWVPVTPGNTARVGGRLFEKSSEDTPKAIRSLHETLSATLDTALESVDLARLTLPSLSVLLETMAKSAGARNPVLPESATMVPVTFASPDRRLDERKDDIARILTAIETVDGRDWLEVFLKGVSSYMDSRLDLDQEYIEETLETIRNQRKEPNSQIARFLAFLEDEALSRLRFQVTLRIMEAVAAQSSKPALKTYVSRVNDCFNLFADVRGGAFNLDVSSAYGVHNCPPLHELLATAGFYACLPAWPEWSAQLFEGKADPSHGFKTKREVSYCFRVNGNNPSAGKPALDARLDNIRERVLDTDNPQGRIQREIAQLAFLWLVIPDNFEEPTPLDVKDAARELAARAKVNPVKTLRDLHTDLLARCKVMEKIANDMVEVLKSKSKAIIQMTNRCADKSTVAVSRNLVNWEAVQSLDPVSPEILCKHEKGEDRIEWFKYLTITSSPTVPGSIASYVVHTEITDRTLTVSGPSRKLNIRRELNTPVLPVRYVPYRFASGNWVPVDGVNPSLMDARIGLDIEYPLTYLGIHAKKEHDKEVSEQLRGATAVALTLLCYILLWELARRTQARLGGQLSLPMLRLQNGSKLNGHEEDGIDPNTAIYTVSQAVEKALMREVPVKLQGLSSKLGDNAQNARYKRIGTLNAFFGGQPLSFRMQGSLKKVALVTYATRPCDSHPAFPQADGFIFQMRTYKATSEHEEARLEIDSMQSRLVESREDFRTPHLILEEVGRLRAEGFEHIMLLSHHHGNRHIGRAEERHAPHGTLQFLDEAYKRFPDVHLYPLRRDVFKATRLRRRDATESGFEVLNFADHQAMYGELEGNDLRSQMPIYTFATMVVVAENARPQSGFCTYFFDVEQRLSNIAHTQTVKNNIIGIVPGEPQGIRASLISVLRGVHFLESEKPGQGTQLLPVLDPFDWANPANASATGELPLIKRRRTGTVLLSLSAVLAHVTKVLHKGPESRASNTDTQQESLALHLTASPSPTASDADSSVPGDAK